MSPNYSEMPTLSIIIVSYNTREMTLECISSIYEETSCHFEIIVVDNASTDGSVDAIREQFPRVRVIPEVKNHFFGWAHHIAYPYCNAPWLLLLNSDTIVLDGAIDKLLEFSRQQPEAGIWGGRTVYKDNSLNPFSCWGRMTLWSLFCRVLGLNVVFSRSEFFNSEAYGGWRRDTEREVDIVTGCFLLISGAKWERLGGFDPVFVMYGEDADLCLRARACGSRPLITPKSTIVHHGGASEKVHVEKMVRLLAAKAELIKKHFPKGKKGIGLRLLAMWPLSRLVVTFLLSFASQGPRKVDKLEKWREVWGRRIEWKDGFGH